MSKVWPYETIKELIALAARTGESRAMLESDRQAELFRQAIYSYRKANNDGWDVTITLQGPTVILTKKPQVTIMQEEKDANTCLQ